MNDQIIFINSIGELRALPTGSARIVVTSPPYGEVGIESECETVDRVLAMPCHMLDLGPEADDNTTRSE